MKKIGVLLFLVLTQFSLNAQFDTTFGTGTFHFVDSIKSKSIPNISATFKAFAIDDTLFNTSYIGVSNSNGDIPFNLPTYFKITIGIDEFGSKTNCLFYPNPASEINVLLPKIGNYMLQIIDLKGSEVGRTEVKNADHIYLSLSSIKNGTYVAIVKDEQLQFVASQKFVKVDSEQYGALRIDQPNFGPGKVAGVGADYQIIYTPPLGYLKDTVIVNLQDGSNGIVPIYVNKLPIDTTFGTATLRLIKGNQSTPNNFVPNAAMAIVALTMDDFTPTTVYTKTTDSLGQSTVTLPVHLDTLNMHTTNVTAMYGIYPPKIAGYVHDTIPLTITEGQNGLLNATIEPWDAAIANQAIRTRNATSSSIIGNIPLTIEVNITEDVAISSIYNFTTSVAGVAIANNINNEIDTTGTNTFSNTGTQWIISSPFVNTTTALDSANVNLQFIGFAAAVDTAIVYNGNNPTFNHFKAPVPVNPLVGKEYIVVKAKEVDRFMNTTAASNAIAVVYRPSTSSSDTIQLDINGNGISSTAYNHGEQVYVGVGQPGGVGVNGESLKSWIGIPVTINGTTLARIANQDTTGVPIKVKLYSDSTYAKFNNAINYVTAAQIDEQFEHINGQACVFDTVYYNLSNLFTAAESANTKTVMDSASVWGSVYCIESATALPNVNPYNYLTALATAHGINAEPGNGSYSVQSGQIITTPYATFAIHSGTKTDHGANKNVIGKENIHRSVYGAGNVSSRTSSGNGNAATATAIDWTIYTIQQDFGKAVLVTGDQNVDMQYISDNNNITGN